MKIERRKEIVETLSVREVDRHGKYLGLPTIIWRSKKAIFTCLKEWIWKKSPRVEGEVTFKAGKGCTNQGRGPSHPYIYDECV